MRIITREEPIKQNKKPNHTHQRIAEKAPGSQTVPANWKHTTCIKSYSAEKSLERRILLLNPHLTDCVKDDGVREEKVTRATSLFLLTTRQDDFFARS